MQDPNQSWRVRIAYGTKWRVRSILVKWVHGSGGGLRGCMVQGWIEGVHGSGGGLYEIGIRVCV